MSSPVKIRYLGGTYINNKPPGCRCNVSSSRSKPVTENQVEHAISIMDARKNDKNYLPVLCAVTLVGVPLSSNVKLLESQ